LKSRSAFELDIQNIRRRAREHMEQGPLTPTNLIDVHTLIRVLNEALATELVCVMRYKNHYYMTRGIRGQLVAEELLTHAHEEQVHADMIAERIAQLGGVPNFNPAELTLQSHTEYREVVGLRPMMMEDLVAERIAIQSYTEIIRWIGHGDPTTRRMLEEILAKEEEHADDLAQLLDEM